MGLFSLPVVKIGSVSMDGTEPVFILGPCVIESEEFIWGVAEQLGAMVDAKVREILPTLVHAEVKDNMQRIVSNIR